MNLMNYNSILGDAKNRDARLVAVSKTKPVEDIQKVYDLGHRIFGENRVTELVQKAKELPSDIEWHMIGHLQRNKVKEVIPYTTLIHAADSVRLINQIQKEASKIDRFIPCLIQLKIATEESKYGFSIDDICEWLDKGDFLKLENIQFSGVMGMATFTDDLIQVRCEFENLKTYFDQIKNDYFKDQPSFSEISMGMSGDYKIALEEGSTIIRVGSSIFGSR